MIPLVWPYIPPGFFIRSPPKRRGAIPNRKPEPVDCLRLSFPSLLGRCPPTGLHAPGRPQGYGRPCDGARVKREHALGVQAQSQARPHVLSWTSNIGGLSVAPCLEGSCLSLQESKLGLEHAAWFCTKIKIRSYVSL